MDVLASYLELQTLSYMEFGVRILLAVIFGLVIGWDREAKNKPIDFRAYMIVAAATCAIAVVGQEVYMDYGSSDTIASIDLGKVVAGVLTGIGFLGAGAIIQDGDTKVVGTATGASIWASGIFGLALGFGQYGVAFITFLVIAAILIVGGAYMKAFNGQEDNEQV
ncbi:MAG: MgtC/SapB family protein [Alphaproteobacteria bacterium]|nr:MgtC/SapB family protein [Alphaproteobacteria bacterium]